jgi:hypothetical protein
VKQLKYLFLIISILFELSCSSRFGDFTVISTRNSNIKNWKRFSERVEGSSCRWYVFLIRVKDWDLKDAIEDAIDTSNKKVAGTGIQSEALLDVKLSFGWFTTILFTRSCIYAEGTPADSWYKTQEREEQLGK